MADAKTVPERLRDLGNIYEGRNKVYGDNYKKFGHVMDKMFPDGLTIQGPEDWNRLGVFTQMLSKISRYADKFPQGRHGDSLDDLAVYAQMLRELDGEV